MYYQYYHHYQFWFNGLFLQMYSVHCAHTRQWLSELAWVVNHYITR